MSESATEAPAEQPQEGGEQQSDGKTFDAEYVDKLRKEAAKYRTEAKANATAATELEQIRESQKTDAEKALDRVTKAEAEVAKVPSLVSAALRDHLIGLHEIDKDDAELFLTGNEPDLLLKQVTRLLAQRDTKNQNSNHVPLEGRNSSAAGGSERETARALFGG